jgi:hypothetical protein
MSTMASKINPNSINTTHEQKFITEKLSVN